MWKPASRGASRRSVEGGRSVGGGSVGWLVGERVRLSGVHEGLGAVDCTDHGGVNTAGQEPCVPGAEAHGPDTSTVPAPPPSSHGHAPRRVEPAQRPHAPPICPLQWDVPNADRPTDRCPSHHPYHRNRPPQPTTNDDPRLTAVPMSNRGEITPVLLMRPINSTTIFPDRWSSNTSNSPM